MLKNLFNKFAKEEKGAPIIEIVILIAISALIAAFLFPTLRDNLGTWFNSMVANIGQGLSGNAAPPSTSTPAGVLNTGW